MTLIYIISLIYITIDFVFIPVISHALITMFGRKKTIQTSAEDYDTLSDSESTGALQSSETMSARKRNSKGLVALATVTWLCAIWIWQRAFLPKPEMTMQIKCSKPNLP